MAKLLEKFDYQITRQTGSHIRLAKTLPTEHSTTRDEVEQNMYEAIELHLQGLKEDGLSIPPSTSFAEYIAVR